MRVVIVGAGYAGLSCALRLAGKSRGRAEITLVNASKQFIERIRLHEQAVGRSGRALDLAAMLAGTGIRLELGYVAAIDLAGRFVEVGGRALAWDRLVLALGSQVDVDRIDGVREHAYTLDATSTPWFAALVPAIAARAGRIAVVGGGLTGIEAATELAEAHPGLRVTLVTRGEVAAEFAPNARAEVRAALSRLGVELREHVTVSALQKRRLQTAGEPIDFDACLWTAGFAAPPLAREAGLDVNAIGQVWVDPLLRSRSHPAVYVAGDLAKPVEPVGDPLPMGCKSAFPTGLHVADNLARALRGERERPFHYRALPFCVSLGRRAGLVQWPAAEGAPPKLFTGKLGARIKELICRGTLWTLALDRRRAAPWRLLPGTRALLPPRGAALPGAHGLERAR